MDHVALLRDGVDRAGGVWADLGAGTGAFTLALADLLGPGAAIHAIDRDGRALAEAVRRTTAAFPETIVVASRADFTLDLPMADASLDGVVVANSLHFVRDKEPTVRRLMQALRPSGRLLLVEYDTDHGNPWVPWPISYPTWQRTAAAAGLVGTRRLASIPSRFLGSIYSAASDRPAATSDRPAATSDRPAVSSDRP